MFFRSLFGSSDGVSRRYPKSQIDAAIERAVLGTDSRLRLLTGYRRRLLNPVIAALDHAVALAEDLPAPLCASSLAYRDEPKLAALFASSESMLVDLGRDRTLRDFLAGPGFAAEQVTVLLRVQLQEKQTLGRDLVDGQMRRDVPQTLVNFAGHRLADPAPTEAETRALYKQRAFDQLVTLALARLTAAEAQRADLTRQRDLLNRKLSALTRGDLTFDAPETLPDRPALSRELERITQQLHRLGSEDKVLRAHLEMVAEVLSDAGRQLWSRDISLHLDAMNIKRHPRDPSGHRIVLHELIDAEDRHCIPVLLTLSPSDLPPPEDFLTAAERHLRSTR